MIIKHLKRLARANTSTAVASVIPDCCNIGVIYRVLLATNAAGVGVIWLRSQTTPQAVVAFLNAAMVLETVCILALLVLCGLRKLMLVQQAPLSLQRSLCGLLPALIALAVIFLIEALPWLFGDLDHVSALRMSIAAAFFGMLFQQHFELRARAFSPALGEARLQALQARIRPHFLFNSINAVLSLIRSDPQRAESALEDLADLFRVLMRDNRDLSTLQQELQLCHQYLSIEKLRLGERLKVEWEIRQLSQQDLAQIQIASLLLQPLIENAVHHGVEPSETPALISIRMERQGDQIAIALTNSYFPGHASKGNQMALDNIRQRLTLLYDMEAELLAEVVGQQFYVSLVFPIQKVAAPAAPAYPAQERRQMRRFD